MEGSARGFVQRLENSPGSSRKLENQCRTHGCVCFLGTGQLSETVQNVGQELASTWDNAERDNARLVETVPTNRLDIVEEDLVIREIDCPVDRN